MKKSKNALLKTGKYLREISVIVLGVAITLSVSQWINNRSQKQDIAIYLSMIKTELEDNIEVLEGVIEHSLMPEIRYTNYLISLRGGQSLNMDSVLSYSTAWLTLAGQKLQSIAFEKFRNSGLMHLINDRELVFLLWQADADLNAANSMFEFHFQEKWNAMKKEDWSELKEFIISNTRQKVSVAPMYDFFIINPFIEVGFSHAVLQTVERYLNTARELLAKLEKVK